MLIYQRIPNYYETDQMGIIHHSNHIRWFEEARLAYIEEQGISFLRDTQSGIISPVVTVNAEYLKVIRLTDKLHIVTKLSLYNGIRYGFTYEIYNQNDELVCRGTSTHCLTDDSGTIIRIKKQYPEYDTVFRKCLKNDS